MPNTLVVVNCPIHLYRNLSCGHGIQGRHIGPTRQVGFELVIVLAVTKIIVGIGLPVNILRNQVAGSVPELATDEVYRSKVVGSFNGHHRGGSVWRDIESFHSAKKL